MTAATKPSQLTSPWRLAGWGLAAAALLLPAIAMQFTSEVNWGPGDFIVAAGLFGLTGLAIEGAVRLSAEPRKRALLAGGALAVLLVVWAELAVGIF